MEIIYEKDIECPICIEVLDIKDTMHVTTLECCNQKIHSVCLNRCMKSSNICPMCRRQLRSQHSPVITPTSQTIIPLVNPPPHEIIPIHNDTLRTRSTIRMKLMLYACGGVFTYFVYRFANSAHH
jgi:hypothetical protein